VGPRVPLCLICPYRSLMVLPRVASALVHDTQVSVRLSRQSHPEGQVNLENMQESQPSAYRFGLPTYGPSKKGIWACIVVQAQPLTVFIIFFIFTMLHYKQNRKFFTYLISCGCNRLFVIFCLLLRFFFFQ
jgi:hypothetical protein